MNKTLIIYDLNGTIISNTSGFYQIPNGIPYLEVEIPQGKRVVSVDVENKQPVYEDIPPNEMEVVQKKISILQEQNANLLLDNAKKKIEINGLNKNLANVTLEVAKIKGGM